MTYGCFLTSLFSLTFPSVCKYQQRIWPERRTLLPILMANLSVLPKLAHRVDDILPQNADRLIVLVSIAYSVPRGYHLTQPNDLLICFGAG